MSALDNDRDRPGDAIVVAVVVGDVCARTAVVLARWRAVTLTLDTRRPGSLAIAGNRSISVSSYYSELSVGRRTVR